MNDLNKKILILILFALISTNSAFAMEMPEKKYGDS